MSIKKQTGNNSTNYISVFAVIRFDSYYDVGTPIEQKVTVQKILVSEEYAKAEVKRLNNLNKDKGSIYFYQPTQLYTGKITRNNSSLVSKWKTPRSKYKQVFVIICYDCSYEDIDTPIDNKITVEKVVTESQDADYEVKKLNEVNAYKRHEYFWGVSRFGN